MGKNHFNSNTPRNMEQFGHGGKQCAHNFEVPSLFYNYFSLNFNIQLKKVRTSQNSKMFQIPGSTTVNLKYNIHICMYLMYLLLKSF